MTKPQKSAEELLSEFKKIMSDHTPPPDSIHAVSLYIDNVIWPKVTRENSPEFKWCMISADFKKNTEKSFKISNSWCFIDLNESNEFVLYISENLKSEKLLKPIHSFYIALTPKFTQSNNASIDLKESF
ncbi:MAG: hypothetical protein KC478_10865, partial [Bacteriovoracaceae bacterium]|nr:hypothetical protein [Bacteriovoracaceae bacterium]